VDPTPALIATAGARDPEGTYLEGSAESLPFPDESFDLVVSYLTLIDIPDIKSGIGEMVRKLKPGGSLLIANLNSFNTACVDTGWVRDSGGQPVHYPIDHYLRERSVWIEYRGIRVQNHHRPLNTYMRTLLDAGLRLSFFDEPAPVSNAPEPKASLYRRVPWFVVMDWVKV
jgi:SAM-dependent methyltransferase